MKREVWLGVEEEKGGTKTMKCKMCENIVPQWRSDDFCCDAHKAADFVNRLFGKRCYPMEKGEVKVT